RFERAIVKLAHGIAGPALPLASASRLLADLDAVVSEEPSLAPLKDAILGGAGLSLSQTEGVARSSFHPLDFALNNLYEVASGDLKTLAALHASEMFWRNGAGTAVLESPHAVHGRQR